MTQPATPPVDAEAATYGTLCFIIRDGRVLLLKKEPELWGGGKWNAPGGKVAVGEDPAAAAAREVEEETGLVVGGLQERGILHFYFGDQPRPGWIVRVYVAGEVLGRLRPSREGILEWHTIEAIPYDEMWADDRHWVPLLLAGHRFFGEFFFDSAAEQLLTYRLEPEPVTPP